MQEAARIKPAAARDAMGNGALLVCVYPQAKYDASHLEGAISMPDWESRRENLPRETQVIFY